jgi:hypothetical protein
MFSGDFDLESSEVDDAGERYRRLLDGNIHPEPRETDGAFDGSSRGDAEIDNGGNHVCGRGAVFVALDLRCYDVTSFLEGQRMWSPFL